MILKIADWIFDVDLGRTAAYSDREAAEHCDCDHCRNFYLGVDATCPELRCFLGQFGIHPEAPDRMSPIGYSTQRIDYDPMYYVFGRIIRHGNSILSAGDVEIIPASCDALFEEGTVFSLSVAGLSLPWLLDVPFDSSIFQQNEEMDLPQ